LAAIRAAGSRLAFEHAAQVTIIGDLERPKLRRPLRFVKTRPGRAGVALRRMNFCAGIELAPPSLGHRPEGPLREGTIERFIEV
jgi:hypothetical protein